MLSNDEDRLRPYWEDAFRAIGLAPPVPAFADLIAHYAEPQRAYHTLQHLAECFDRLDEAGDEPDRAVMALALFFHDVIYDPAAKDNETQSAVYAGRVLEAAGAAPIVVQTVSDLVLATKHDHTPTEPAAQLIVDIDLAILGADRMRFDEYEAQIRREYRFVPDDLFRAGRAAILQSFLARPTIFSTAPFRARYETRARENIARVLGL